MQAKMGTTFEGRLWETADRGVRFEVCPGFTVWAEPAQQRQGFQQGLVAGPCRAVAQAQPWAACVEASVGTAGHLPTTLDTWTRAVPPLSPGWHRKTYTKPCMRAQLAQRVFPSAGNQGRSFWAQTKGKHLKSIHPPAHVPEHVRTYGLLSETKRKAPCVYAHPSPSPKTFARFLFSRQVFHELQ